MLKHSTLSLYFLKGEITMYKNKEEKNKEELELTIQHLIVISIVTLAFVRAVKKRSIPVINNYYIIPSKTPTRYI